MPINVISKLKPINSSGFPVVEDTDVEGGYQVVADTTARNAIPANNRKDGMLVFSIANNEFYKLSGGTTDGYWVRWQYANIVPTILGSTGSNGVLKTQHNGKLGNTVYATGCVTDGDGGGGLFEWYTDLYPTDPDDNGTYITPSPNNTDDPGCWRRIYDGPLNVKWFGAQGTYVTEGASPLTTPDDTNAFGYVLAAASTLLNAHGIIQKIYIPSGIYLITSSLTFSATSFEMFGDGNTSVLWFTITSGSALTLGTHTKVIMKDFVIMRPNILSYACNALTHASLTFSTINLRIAGPWNNMYLVPDSGAPGYGGGIEVSDITLSHIHADPILPRSWGGASNIVPVDIKNGLVVFSWVNACNIRLDIQGSIGTACHLNGNYSAANNSTISGSFLGCASGIKISSSNLLDIRDCDFESNGINATAVGCSDIVKKLPLTLTSSNNTLFIESNAVADYYSYLTVTIATGTYTTTTSLLSAIQTGLDNASTGIAVSLDSLGRYLQFTDASNPTYYINIFPELLGSTFNSVAGLNGYPRDVDVVIEGAGGTTVGPRLHAYNLQLLNCSNTKIISPPAQLYIDENCSSTFILGGINNIGTKNNSKSTSFVGAVNTGNYAFASAQSIIDSNNLVLNGDFSRWINSHTPWGYSTNNNVDKCGLGQTDTTRTFASNYCAKVYNDDGNYALIAEFIPNPDNVLGKTWVARDSQRNWKCICSSSTGQYLYAGNYGGYFYASSNYGVTWTQLNVNNVGTKNWKACCCSSDGSTIYVVVYAGAVYKSTDYGATWTTMSAASSSPANFTSCAMSSTGQVIVLTVDNDQLNVSINYGSTWGYSDSIRNWSSVSMSSDGYVIAAVVNGGKIYRSTNRGTSFVESGTNKAWIAVAVSADGLQTAYAVNGGYIYKGTDQRAISANWVSLAISSDGSNLVAGTSDAQIYVSNDTNTTWKAYDTSRNWDAVAMSSTGRRIVAGTYGDYIFTSDTSVLTNDLEVGVPVTVSAKVKLLSGTNQINVNIRDTSHEEGDIGREVWRSGLGVAVENGFRLVSLTRAATQAMVDNGVEVAFSAYNSNTVFYVSEVMATVGCGTPQQFIRRELSYDGYTRISPEGLLTFVGPTYPIVNGDPIYNSNWQIGDFIKNSAVIQLGINKKYIIRGWRCSAAGSPGTWIPEICYNQVLERSFSSVQTGTYYILVTDDIILCNSSGGSFNVYLPSNPSIGEQYTVQDYYGAAATYNIVIDGNGKNIAGASTWSIINNFNSVNIIYNGTFWAIL